MTDAGANACVPDSHVALDNTRLSALFEVERRARSADKATTLRFIIANETRGLLDYRQAALLESAATGWRVTAISDVAAVDRSTTYVQWLERIARHCRRDADGAQTVEPAQLPDWERSVWQELSPPAALLVPIARPDRPPAAWLWLARADGWSAADRLLLEHLGEVYGHALNALAPQRSKGALRRSLKKRWVWLLAGIVLAGLLILPVHLSALAPAEIVARNPSIVAAPMDGVVEKVLVEPNARVEKGQPLVRLQALEVRNRFDVAREALEVARARYAKARQESFESPESRAEMATLQAEVGLREVERRFAQQKLEKIVIRAAQDGIVIFNDPNEWAGRPVQTGERIMQLANPAVRELRVRLPVDDAVLLEQGAPLKLFLDARPLEPLAGAVLRVSYKPVVTPQDQVVYHVTARLNEDRPYLRIGLRGTAKVSGPRVPLAYYLFRRPLTALRQMIGI